jgi:phthalate 4,5-dioxygenase
MTTQAEHEILNHVGAGTPMGNLLRQFWVPACKSSELERGGAPMRLMLLGEKLIAFRDSAGRPGIFDHRCPHRCASLFFGRNESDGLRCVYHGWKFDVDGNCLEMPNLPEEQRFEKSVRANAYKTTERAGLVYVYMGQRETAPPFPDIEPTLCAPEDSETVLTQRDCNWIQALEGDIDTSHSGFLHTGSVNPDNLDPSQVTRYAVIRKAPHILVEETPSGAMYTAARPADPGLTFHRFAHFILPFWVTYPHTAMEQNVSANAWVPIDDEHTMIFNIGKKSVGGVGQGLRRKDGSREPGLARPLEYLPQTTDWQGRWRPKMNATADYGLDREAQRTWSFTGIVGIPLQDQMIQESMGPIVDRPREHLAASDRMIMTTRRLLVQAAVDYAETGKLPAMLDNPSLCADARGGDLLCPENTDWRDAYKQAIDRIKGRTSGQAAAE